MKLAHYFTTLSLLLNIVTAEDAVHRPLDSFVSELYRTSVKLAESSKVSSPIGLALSLEALRSILSADETKLNETIKDFTGNEGKMSALKVLIDEIRKNATLGLYAYTSEGQSYNKNGIETLENSGHLVSRIDFNNPTEACSIINKQVSEDTDGKIPELISPGAINLDTGLILLNTLHLKHKWWEAFHDTTMNFKIHGQTYHARFLESKRRLFSAPLSETKILGIIEWSGYKMIKIPSKNDNYSLYIKLPIGRSQPEPITEDDMRKFQQTLEFSLTDFYMPHVSLDGNLDFEKALGVLGNTNAKTILTDKPWMAGGIHQRIIVEWDHRGIEAAAATYRCLYGSSGRRESIVVFHVDRPFTFMYAMKSSHTSVPIPLFTGVVDSPNDLKLVKK